MDKFFDSVSFWQQAFEQSEERQSKLQDQVHELQQKIDGLVRKLRVQDLDGIEPAQANKRKAPIVAKNTAGSIGINKRAKLSGNHNKAYSLMDDDGSGDGTGRKPWTLLIRAMF